MKFTASILIFITGIFLTGFDMRSETTTENLYDFTVNNIRGNEVPLSEFKGKALLIVNTASMCGYTKQYDDLQAVHDKYADKGFAVLGFPAGNFGGQEYGTDEEIAEFCEVNFNISFPLFSKVSVKGNDQHDLFAYLTSLENEDFTGDINWNFEKFLISPEGQLLRRFRSNVVPTSEELTSAIEAHLPS